MPITKIFSKLIGRGRITQKKNDSRTMIVGLLIIAVTAAGLFWHFKVANLKLKKISDRRIFGT
ncbi:MAG: hypothetical protein IJS81_09505 [Selenomonadaceae bacterium]|nr:hypothetical protein [Selenomonadaceae bacterium]